MKDELLLTKAQAGAFLRFMGKEPTNRATGRLHIKGDGSVFATDGHRLLLWRTGRDLPSTSVWQPVLLAVERLATGLEPITIRATGRATMVSCAEFARPGELTGQPDDFPPNWRKIIEDEREPGTQGPVAVSPRLFADVQALFEAIGDPQAYCELRLGPHKDGRPDPLRFDSGQWTALVMPQALKG